MIVVKLGGSLGFNNLGMVLDDITDLWNSGTKLVLVHGGGRMVTNYAKKLGIKQKFYKNPSGFTTRLTDEDTIKVFEMVIAGLYNKELVAGLLRRGIYAIGLSGVDGGLIKGARKKRILVIDERGRKRFIYGDYSGRPREVEVELLTWLIKNEYLPVIAPIGVDEDWNIINMDGDRVAALIASSLKAEKLLLLTDVNCLILNGEPVFRLSLDEVKTIIGRIEGGMKRKLLACIEALKGGVREVLIASGLRNKPVSLALSHINCTVITSYD